jgi:hypothetical protein
MEMLDDLFAVPAKSGFLPVMFFSYFPDSHNISIGNNQKPAEL